MRRLPRTQRVIGDVLRKARKKQGWSARELSNMLGESHNYISQLETAKRECSAAELIAIARKLKRRPGSMLDEVDRIVRRQGPGT